MLADLIREIAQTLRNNRLRTALTGLAVAWGIFMLIVLLGAARGVVNSFNAHMGDDSSNIIQMWGGMTSMPYKGYKEGRFIQLKGTDIAAIEKDNPNMSAIAFASADTAKIFSAIDFVTGFEAVYPEAARSNKLTVTNGRFINDRDIEECRRVLVLSEQNARLLFKDPAEALGKVVKCMGLGWTVIGYYSHRWENSNYAPYTTYKALTGNNDDAYQLNVTVNGLTDEASGTAAEAAIKSTLAKQHTFAEGDPSALWSWNRFTDYIRNRQGFVYLNIAVWVIGLFTLLSGIVGVSNIMFVSVRERTHEIGIRRAIGAKPRNILVQVLAESVSITTLFGYIGIVLGMIVLQLVDMFVGEAEGFQHPTVDLSMAFQVTIALIVAGALAGLFPALKAIKVKPVEALRDE